MTLKSRLQKLEYKLKTNSPDCNPALLFLQYEGEEALKPTQEQIDQFLRESGQCQSCSGGQCIIYYDGQHLHHQGGQQ